MKRKDSKLYYAKYRGIEVVFSEARIINGCDELLSIFPIDRNNVLLELYKLSLDEDIRSKIAREIRDKLITLDGGHNCELIITEKWLDIWKRYEDIKSALVDAQAKDELEERKQTKSIIESEIMAYCGDNDVIKNYFKLIISGSLSFGVSAFVLMAKASNINVRIWSLRTNDKRRLINKYDESNSIAGQENAVHVVWFGDKEIFSLLSLTQEHNRFYYDKYVSYPDRNDEFQSDYSREFKMAMEFAANNNLIAAREQYQAIVNNIKELPDDYKSRIWWYRAHAGLSVIQLCIDSHYDEDIILCLLRVFHLQQNGLDLLLQFLAKTEEFYQQNNLGFNILPNSLLTDYLCTRNASHMPSMLWDRTLLGLDAEIYGNNPLIIKRMTDLVSDRDNPAEISRINREVCEYALTNYLDRPPYNINISDLPDVQSFDLLTKENKLLVMAYVVFRVMELFQVIVPYFSNLRAQTDETSIFGFDLDNVRGEIDRCCQWTSNMDTLLENVELKLPYIQYLAEIIKKIKYYRCDLESYLYKLIIEIPEYAANAEERIINLLRKRNAPLQDYIYIYDQLSLFEKTMFLKGIENNYCSAGGSVSANQLLTSETIDKIKYINLYKRNCSFLSLALTQARTLIDDGVIFANAGGYSEALYLFTQAKKALRRYQADYSAMVLYRCAVYYCDAVSGLLTIDCGLLEKMFNWQLIVVHQSIIDIYDRLFRAIKASLETQGYYGNIITASNADKMKMDRHSLYLFNDNGLYSDVECIHTAMMSFSQLYIPLNYNPQGYQYSEEQYFRSGETAAQYYREACIRHRPDISRPHQQTCEAAIMSLLGVRDYELRNDSYTNPDYSQTQRVLIMHIYLLYNTYHLLWGLRFRHSDKWKHVAPSELDVYYNEVLDKTANNITIFNQIKDDFSYIVYIQCFLNDYQKMCNAIKEYCDNYQVSRGLLLQEEQGVLLCEYGPAIFSDDTLLREEVNQSIDMAKRIIEKWNISSQQEAVNRLLGNRNQYPVMAVCVILGTICELTTNPVVRSHRFEKGNMRSKLMRLYNGPDLLEYTFNLLYPHVNCLSSEALVLLLNKFRSIISLYKYNYYSYQNMPNLESIQTLGIEEKHEIEEGYVKDILMRNSYESADLFLQSYAENPLIKKAATAIKALIVQGEYNATHTLNKIVLGATNRAGIIVVNPSAEIFFHFISNNRLCISIMAGYKKNNFRHHDGSISGAFSSQDELYLRGRIAIEMSLTDSSSLLVQYKSIAFTPFVKIIDDLFAEALSIRPKYGKLSYIACDRFVTSSPAFIKDFIFLLLSTTGVMALSSSLFYFIGLPLTVRYQVIAELSRMVPGPAFYEQFLREIILLMLEKFASEQCSVDDYYRLYSILPHSFKDEYINRIYDLPVYTQSLTDGSSLCVAYEKQQWLNYLYRICVCRGNPNASDIEIKIMSTDNDLYLHKNIKDWLFDAVLSLRDSSRGNNSLYWFRTAALESPYIEDPSLFFELPGEKYQFLFWPFSNNAAVNSFVKRIGCSKLLIPSTIIYLKIPDCDKPVVVEVSPCFAASQLSLISADEQAITKTEKTRILLMSLILNFNPYGIKGIITDDRDVYIDGYPKAQPAINNRDMRNSEELDIEVLKEFLRLDINNLLAKWLEECNEENNRLSDIFRAWFSLLYSPEKLSNIKLLDRAINPLNNDEFNSSLLAIPIYAMKELIWRLVIVQRIIAAEMAMVDNPVVPIKKILYKKIISQVKTQLHDVYLNYTDSNRCFLLPDVSNVISPYEITSIRSGNHSLSVNAAKHILDEFNEMSDSEFVGSDIKAILFEDDTEIARIESQRSETYIGALLSLFISNFTPFSEKLRQYYLATSIYTSHEVDGCVERVCQILLSLYNKSSHTSVDLSLYSKIVTDQYVKSLIINKRKAITELDLSSTNITDDLLYCVANNMSDSLVILKMRNIVNLNFYDKQVYVMSNLRVLDISDCCNLCYLLFQLPRLEHLFIGNNNQLSITHLKLMLASKNDLAKTIQHLNSRLQSLNQRKRRMLPGHLPFDSKDAVVLSEIQALKGFCSELAQSVADRTSALFIHISGSDVDFAFNAIKELKKMDVVFSIEGSHEFIWEVLMRLYTAGILKALMSEHKLKWPRRMTHLRLVSMNTYQSAYVIETLQQLSPLIRRIVTTITIQKPNLAILELILANLSSVSTIILNSINDSAFFVANKGGEKNIISLSPVAEIVAYQYENMVLIKDNSSTDFARIGTILKTIAACATQVSKNDILPYKFVIDDNDQRWLVVQNISLFTLLWNRLDIRIHRERPADFNLSDSAIDKTFSI